MYKSCNLVNSEVGYTRCLQKVILALKTKEYSSTVIYLGCFRYVHN